MGVAEERLQVLRMIQSSQITADEGARLLEALEDRTREVGRPEGRGKQPREFRIRVTDLETGQQKVSINLPWSLVSVGIEMGARFARREIKLQDVVEAIEAGAEGKVMDVVDEEENEHVEIFVE